MGVSGSGKTTVGTALAAELKATFYDGDDFHPPENVAKMAAGIALNDEDRHPWLLRIHSLIADHLKRGESAVIACSALKKKYRDQLRAGNDGLYIVYLQGSFEQFHKRLEAREGHYMKAELLQSQFDTLEPPSAARHTIIINSENRIEHIVNTILQDLADNPS